MSTTQDPDIVTLVRAGVPIICVRTTEQERVSSEILEKCAADEKISQMELLQWRVTTGLTRFSADWTYAEDPLIAEKGLPETLLWLLRRGLNEHPDPKIIFMFNPGAYMKSAPTVQGLRDLGYALRVLRSSVILMGCDMEIPPETDELVTVVDWPFPSREKLERAYRSFAIRNASACTFNEDDLSKAVECASGLPLLKAENAIACSVIRTGRIDPATIQDEKVNTVKKGGVLQIVDVGNESLETVGSFDAVKQFVHNRKRMFTPEARAYKLDPPKGLLVAGLPGVGKSLLAKAVAATLELTLYSLDVGALFKPLVGKSEETVRCALQQIEAAAPCVLQIDEIDKAFSGLNSSGSEGTGVTQRVMATLMSWMAESKAQVFKIASANDISRLPSALARRGRWDEVFGVVLPVYLERIDILRIHLKKRDRDPSLFDVEAVADATDGFIGAELESIVQSAMITAFSDTEARRANGGTPRDINTQDLLNCAAQLVPLSRTAKEEFKAFELWMKDRARPASTIKDTPKNRRKKSGTTVAVPKIDDARVLLGFSDD